MQRRRQRNGDADKPPQPHDLQAISDTTKTTAGTSAHFPKSARHRRNIFFADFGKLWALANLIILVPLSI
jgi:hypothetical protein